jgi:hypothetical protein
MRQKFLFAALFSAQSFAAAQISPPPTLPKGWVVNDESELPIRSDFNSDGKEDFAAILRNEEGANGVFVAIRNPATETLEMLFFNEKAARKMEAMRGADGFTGMSYVPQAKVLTLNYDGGGTLRESDEYKFRFQNGDFFLIGSVHQAYSIGSDCHRGTDCRGRRIESNYSTGIYEITGGGRTVRKKIPESKPVTLRDFPGELFHESHYDSDEMF